MTLLFIRFISFCTEHASPIEQVVRTLLLCSLELSKIRNSRPSNPLVFVFPKQMESSYN